MGVSYKIPPRRIEGDLLHGITDTLVYSELFTTKKVNVHVNALLHGSNLSIDATSVKEGFDVAMTEDGCETLAGNGETGKTTSHLSWFQRSKQ